MQLFAKIGVSLGVGQYKIVRTRRLKEMDNQWGSIDPH